MNPATGSRGPARPKRAGDEFNLSQLRAAGEPSSKKARFDARNPSTLVDDVPEDDPILDMDVIGTKGQQTKRNAVELDGYESDSSNENFDTRAEAKAESQRKAKRNAAKSKDEEDNDMFADLDEDFADGDDDEDDGKEGKKRRKEVRFMEENDIEGQIASSKSGGHVSADFSLNGKGKQKDMEAESSSDDSGDDEERDKIGEDVDEELGAGSKKKHAPKLDAFNMRNEAEEGKFDDSGNFIRKATDPYAVHDSWLEGASKAEIKRAKEAQDKRDEERRKRDIADDAISTGDILAVLISRMEEGETVLEALARLGTAKQRKQKPKWQKNKRKTGTDMELDEESAENEAAESKRKETVEAITAAADQLLTRGQTEIYEAERALLMRQYRRETGEAWVDKAQDESLDVKRADSNEWEYRWSDARDGGEHHGPYDSETMKAWNEAGYFGEGVEFRHVGGDSWTQIAEFI